MIVYYIGICTFQWHFHSFALDPMSTTQSWEWKSKLCQGLPGLKRPAWLKICWGFWQSPVPQPWCPITKEPFLAQGCVGFRFSQTLCFIATVWQTVDECNVSYPRLDTVWRHPMFLDSVWLPKEIALPKMYKNLSLKTFHILQLQACVDQIITWFSFASGINQDAA